jgi:UDP-N-acetylglucosamine 4,6-dehydratase
VVGIRPGEKLHEVMIAEGDARMTVELPDRYVIPASGRGHVYHAGQKPVPEDFEYASDSNTDWLDKESMKAILAHQER